MGCFAVVFVLAIPRVVMVFMWLFSDYLSRAYEGWLVPFLGFFFLPTTTLTFAIAENEAGGPEGWWMVLVVLGVLSDLGIWGGGRGIFAGRDR